MSQLHLFAPTSVHATTTQGSTNSQYQDLPIICESFCCDRTLIEVSKLPRHCTKLRAAMIGFATTIKVRECFPFVIPMLTAGINQLIDRPSTTALEIFYKVKQIRESHPNVESGSVIHPMLRIGNIHLCQGEIEKALECFSEVSAWAS